MKLKLDMSCHLLNAYTKFQIDISKHVEKKSGKLGRTDGRTDGHCHSIIRPFFKRAYKNKTKQNLTLEDHPHLAFFGGAQSFQHWNRTRLHVRVTPCNDTVKCHYNACHYNANASLTRSILGSQTAPTCPHDHPRVAQHMVYRCEIIAVWSATAAMTPLCSHTNGMKQRHPTCWLCQCSRFMIDLRSNTLIIHLRCSENAINRPIWLTDARMLKTISVAIKLT